MPVIPTGIHPHMLIPGCILVNSLQDVCYQFFSLFGRAGANPSAKVHQNKRWPATHSDLPSCHISSPCVNTHQRYPLQKLCGQRKKQTENGISPQCLLACEDKNNSVTIKVYLHIPRYGCHILPKSPQAAGGIWRPDQFVFVSDMVATHIDHRQLTILSEPRISGVHCLPWTLPHWRRLKQPSNIC